MLPYALGAQAPLSHAELTAAVLDGDLVPVSRRAYSPTAMPPSAVVRAAAAGAMVPNAHAAVRTTAAWIHGALPEEPDPHHVQRIAGEPASRLLRAGVAVHLWPLPAEDLTTMGGVRVTTLERTCYDVARETLLGDDGASARAFAWFRASDDLRDALLTWLTAGRRLAYTRRIAAILQEDVTRYTS